MASSQQTERLERALDAAHAVGAEAVLSIDPASVTWLLGGVPPDSAMPWALPAIAFLDASGERTLILSELSQPPPSGWSCVRYRGSMLEPKAPMEAVSAAIAGVVGRRRVGCDLSSFPARLARDLECVDIGSRLAAARAVKGEAEVVSIAAACGLCDAAQAAARGAAREGASELEVFAALRAGIESRTGLEAATVVDVISGPRSGLVGGAPTDRRLGEGETMIVDVIAGSDGYWGDSCSTLATSEGQDLAEARGRVSDALGHGIEAAVAGATAGEVDTALRGSLNFPHHGGHGVGTSYFEPPFIVPGSDAVLEPGMVIALEPGFYSAGFGIRLEQVLVVRDDGNQVLSGHSLDP